MAKKTAIHGLSGADRALQTGMATIGAALLLASLGVILTGALRPHSPAFVEVIETERDVIDGRTRVQVEAVNRGDETASTVLIEGTAAGRTTASVTMDYVPGGSRKAGTLSFDGDLGGAPVVLEASGWVDP